MKINVLTCYGQIIPFDVNPDATVEDVKAQLNAEGKEFLYEGNEMNDSDKLSDVGVKQGDTIVIVPDSDAVSSSSQSKMGFNQDGAAAKIESFQQDIRHDTDLLAQLFQSDPEFAQAISGDDLYRLQDVVRQRHQLMEGSRQGEEDLFATDSKGKFLTVGGREVFVPFFAEYDITSHLLDEDRYSEQESLGGSNDVNEAVKHQTNGCCALAEENVHDSNHASNSSVKESFSTSIEKVGSGNHNDPHDITSSNHIDSDVLLANHSQGVEGGNVQLLDSSLFPSTVSSPTTNPPTATKGYGLKKWRRIRRDVSKDGSSSIDSTKMLKRGSSNILDVMQHSGGSVSSTNAYVDNPGHAGLFSGPVASSNYGLAFGTNFSAGADDNEDRSSKSSTAASVPKHRHDVIRAVGQREKLKGKNMSGRHLNSSGQKLHVAKGHTQAEGSKKPRGENIDVEKENSLSSMESGSRSYSTVFFRGSVSVNSDQLQSRRSANFGGDGYDHSASEVQSAEKFQDDLRQNGELSPECSAEFSCSADEGKSKDHRRSRNCEPLVDSILMLQSAQEALEREIQMFKEIRKGIHSLCDESGKTSDMFVGSKFLDREASMNGGSDGWDSELNHTYLSKNELTLERQLEEANVSLKGKEARKVELEMIIKNMESIQVGAKSTMELQQKRCQEIEADLEGLFKQKIEAEVQYVTMAGSTKDLGLLVEDQIKLLRTQSSIAEEQAQSLRLMSDVGEKAAILQDQAEKLETLCTDVAGDGEVQKIQSRVVKISLCFFIQLVLLILVLGFFLLPLLPKSTTIVPT